MKKKTFCTVERCNLLNHSHGLCNKHRLRLRRNGNLEERKVSDTYLAVHKWFIRIFGTAQKCRKCGEAKKRIHWANKDHTYLRNERDWIPLCAHCHRLYDIQHNNYLLKRYQRGYRYNSSF